MKPAPARKQGAFQLSITVDLKAYAKIMRRQPHKRNNWKLHVGVPTKSRDYRYRPHKRN
ncbi:MAG: hypothetical protein ACW97V_20035 [Promethearchaeota archaeon]